MNRDPLVGPPPAEVPLPSAPLVHVVAQVRFPLVVSVESADFIAGFQESIRGEYPVLRQQSTRNLLLSTSEPSGVQVRSNSLWRFQTLDHQWWVTLGTDFLSLETSRYPSRAAFFDRFERLLEALKRHIRPGALDRLGVRYVDQLTGPVLEGLSLYVRAELVGLLASGLASHAEVAVGEALLAIPEERGRLRARWGLIPAGTTLDPSVLNPVSEPSWVLDVDAFQEGERPFEAGEVAEQARALSRRAYSFFRWAVSDAFLAHYGGGCGV